MNTLVYFPSQAAHLCQAKKQRKLLVRHRLEVSPSLLLCLLIYHRHSSWRTLHQRHQHLQPPPREARRSSACASTARSRIAPKWTPAAASAWATAAARSAHSQAVRKDTRRAASVASTAAVRVVRWPAAARSTLARGSVADTEAGSAVRARIATRRTSEAASAPPTVVAGAAPSLGVPRSTRVAASVAHTAEPGAVVTRTARRQPAARRDCVRTTAAPRSARLATADASRAGTTALCARRVQRSANPLMVTAHEQLLARTLFRRVFLARDDQFQRPPYLQHAMC